MNLVEFLTAFGFIGIVAVFLVKLLNLMNATKFYKVDKAILLFIFSLLCWFIVLIGTLSMLSIYAGALLKLSSVLTLTAFFFTIGEVLYSYTNLLVRKPRRAMR